MSENNNKWWQTKPWSERSRGQKIGMIAGWGIIVLVLAILVLDSNEEQPVPSAKAEVAKAVTPPEREPAEMLSDRLRQSVSKLSRDITEVAQVADGEKQVLVIDIKPSSGYSDSSFFFMATEDIKKVLSKLVKQLPGKPADRVDFIISTGLTDKYGNSQNYQLINLSFDMTEIRKINFSGGNFTSWDLLRLAGSVKYLHPAGRKIVAGYCNDEGNTKYALDFCRASL